MVSESPTVSYYQMGNVVLTCVLSLALTANMERDDMTAKWHQAGRQADRQGQRLGSVIMKTERVGGRVRIRKESGGDMGEPEGRRAGGGGGLGDIFGGRSKSHNAISCRADERASGRGGDWGPGRPYRSPGYDCPSFSTISGVY